MDTKVAVKDAIVIAGSEAKLARLAGCSQVAINKAKHAGKVSAEMAVRIDRATAGAVPKSRLRPDLWSSDDFMPPSDRVEAAE